MEKILQFGFVCAFIAVFVSSETTCKRPELEVQPFTTQDATVLTNIAYIAEFKLTCQTGSVTNLYSNTEGNIGPVAEVGPNTYQVSWVEEVKSASSGDRVIHLYDEDRYTALRKAVRSGEDVSSVRPLASIVLNHPGAFSGPWFRSESVALVIGIIISYIALSSRAKLSS